MKRAIVIGHLDWCGNNMIGAVVKARNLYEELQNQLGKSETGSLDIYEWKKRKIKVLFGIMFSFATYKNIVLVCSDTNKALIRLLGVLKKIFHNKVHYCVVGGDIADILKLHHDRIKPLMKIDGFYVETEDCIRDLNSLGFKNVHLLRNFKCIVPVCTSSYSFEGTFRFCTFSRVIEQKGISDAIKAVNVINERYGKQICELDIYGPVDASYKTEFESLLAKSKAVRYCGVVESNESVNVLKDYFCLLFPTRYQTEGIPGTIIDGFAAGLPVICADWVRCRQLVTDGVDGLIYKFGDFDALVDKMVFSINNPEYIQGLKEGCNKAFFLYRPEIAIHPLISRLD